MQIKTYTHIWNMPRVFYTFGNMNLPRPVSLLSAAIFLGVGLVWIPLIWFVFHPPVGSPFTWMLLLGGPGIAAWMGNKPVFEDKNIVQYLGSQFHFIAEPPTWSDLEPDKNLPGQGYANQHKWWEPFPEESEEQLVEPSKNKKRSKKGGRKRK